jgi:hypothetical protein
MQTSLATAVSACILSLIACTQHSTRPSEQWVDTSNIHPQQTKQSTLTSDQITRIKKAHAILGEVDTSSLDQTIGDFEKDRDPEREIRIWESIADGYQSYCSRHQLSEEGKTDVFGLLLLRSGTSDEKEIMTRVQLKELTPEEARTVISVYRGDWGPIEVEHK